MIYMISGSWSCNLYYYIWDNRIQMGIPMEYVVHLSGDAVSYYYRCYYYRLWKEVVLVEVVVYNYCSVVA